MKKITLLISIMFLALIGASAIDVPALSPGDIAIIAFSSDEGDDFAFVALADIPASTSIWITDNEWTGSAFNDINEGELQWSHTETLSAGSVVVITDPSASATMSASIGTITGSGWNYGASNEWAYVLLEAPATTYTSIPVFLAAFANDAGTDWLLNTGLVEGTTAIDFDNDNDGFKYTGSKSGQVSFAGYLPLIYNSSNWQIEASDGELILPISADSFIEGEDMSPSITIIPTSIDFSYIEGAGPSVLDSFTIQAANFVTGINFGFPIPTNYQLFADRAAAVAINSAVSFDVSASIDTTFYVRLNAGLSAGLFSETIAIDTSLAVVAPPAEGKSASVVHVSDNDFEVDLGGEVFPAMYSLPFSEDFEDGIPADWTNYAQVGTAVWATATFSSNTYPQMSTHSSGEPVNTTWLVSPKINLAATAYDAFSFDINSGYSGDDDTLQVFYSVDYDGADVDAATWVELTSNFSIPKNAGTYGTLASAGVADLSAISGTVYIAFRYIGIASTGTGTFQVDNVEVEESTPTILDEDQIGPKVFASNGSIVVSAEGQHSISVYDITGAQISKVLMNGDATIAVKQGIYLVRVADKVVKVAVQ